MNQIELNNSVHFVKMNRDSFEITSMCTKERFLLSQLNQIDTKWRMRESLIQKRLLQYFSKNFQRPLIQFRN